MYSAPILGQYTPHDHLAMTHAYSTTVSQMQICKTNQNYKNKKQQAKQISINNKPKKEITQ